MARAFFYDTWAFVALSNAADLDHAAAESVDRELEAMGYAATTSDNVLDETLTLLHVVAGSRAALDFLNLFEARLAGEDLMLLEVNSERRNRAVTLFRRLAPKVPRISFTDCTSLSLMQELGIKLAFTADAHFRAAGLEIRPLFERKGKQLRAQLPES
jgi:predicted nucleic acid-binding protein